VLFTDGLVDLKNDQNEYYDESHIEEYVIRHGGESALDFNQGLIKELEKFKGSREYPDDIAILTCRISQTNEE